MLNIEVIKFEAQDVITASGKPATVPTTPLQPATRTHTVVCEGLLRTTGDLHKMIPGRCDCECHD